jgi:hypothetical protein
MHFASRADLRRRRCPPPRRIPLGGVTYAADILAEAGTLANALLSAAARNFSLSV